MRNKEAKELIGKRVEWEFAHCRHRGTCLVAQGRVEQVAGNNIMISGEWRWLPDLKNLCEVAERGSSVRVSADPSTQGEEEGP